jgi:hypothetical protein
MRQQLLQAFTEIYILNLHGNSNKGEVAPDGSKDVNVFDIQEGVTINLFVKEPNKSGPAKIYYADLWGLRDDKYKWLFAEDVQTTKWDELGPQSPFYLFVPQDIDLLPEYNQGWLITDVFNVFASTVTTARNHFAMAFEPETLVKRINDLRNEAVDDNTLREKYKLVDVSYWSLSTARKELSEIERVEDFVKPYCYRPFDFRFVYYHKAICERLRTEVMRHMLANNVAFLTHRPQSPKDFTFAYCTYMIGDQNVAANKSVGGGNSFQFPLYLYPTGEVVKQKSLFPSGVSPWPGDAANGGRTPNLNPAFVQAMEEKLGLVFNPHPQPLSQKERGGRPPLPGGEGRGEGQFTPEDIFHAPVYRRRYAEFLKIDFPRVPLTSDVALFRSLCGLGQELVGLHLLEFPLAYQERAAERGAPGVGGEVRYPIAGDNRVEKGYPKYIPPKDDQPGRVNINNSQYFEGVAPEVWGFYVGGYQVCDKWLKDRQGRQLSYDDLTHYQKMMAALHQTIELMAKIDSAIPKWPIE